MKTPRSEYIQTINAYIIRVLPQNEQLSVRKFGWIGNVKCLDFVKKYVNDTKKI